MAAGCGPGCADELPAGPSPGERQERAGSELARFEGKKVFITGAARGQGRSHALAFAREGADIIAVDVPAEVATSPYAMASEEDLQETVRLVEECGARIVAQQADVRSQEDLDAAVTAGLAAFGHIDVVVANAGIYSAAPAWEQTEQQWTEMVDINLNGVWRTAKAAIPSMIDAGRGGSIILTSSNLGLVGALNSSSYVSSKHGVVGLMRALANDLGRYRIRVNTVNPTNVPTDMIMNPTLLKIFRPDLDDPKPADVVDALSAGHLLPVPWVEPEDISSAVLWLASDESRFVTGTTLQVDAGAVGQLGNVRQ
nr:MULTISPECIES: mycofactocin-coupled SDR family oxidoreductase [unclassified Nocardioides]